MMTGSEYQSAAMRTCNVNNPMDKLVNGVMGLAGESGECTDLVKKYIFHGHDLDGTHLAKELGDVLWYIAITADAIGYTLDDIMHMNVQKLWARYPDGFETERSRIRQEGDL